MPLFAARAASRIATGILVAGGLVATAGPFIPPATAAPADAGLYGSEDPAGDGVWRQSAAITGLAANGITPPTIAITWLLRQQCADGSFQAYRADLSVPCPPSDPVGYTGPDTNQTAMALTALMAVDTSRLTVPRATLTTVVDAADRAAVWLRAQQNADGGWPYYPGGASDANSTGVALSALLTQAPSTDFPAYRRGAAFLATVAAPCSAGGGLSYQSGLAVDSLATGQGLMGLVGAMPVSGPRTLKATAACRASTASKAAHWLSVQMNRSGALTSALDPGKPAYASTATAVIALVAGGSGGKAVTKGTSALRSAASTFIAQGGVTAIGMLLQVAEATGSSATSFGGVDLVRSLSSTLRR